MQHLIKKEIIKTAINACFDVSSLLTKRSFKIGKNATKKICSLSSGIIEKLNKNVFLFQIYVSCFLKI